MNFIGLWIKVIAEISFSVLVLFCGYGMYKKFGWKLFELLITACFALFILGWGVKDLYYISNPQIENKTLQYLYNNQEGVVFGRTYYFQDSNGTVYDLVIDPITWRKVVKSVGINDFEKDNVYAISFEEQSRVVLKVEQMQRK